MSKTQVGGYEFNQECTRIRNAANTIRDALQKMIDGNNGPQSTVAYVAKMAVQIGIILDAIGNIEEIGRQSRDQRTTPRK